MSALQMLRNRLGHNSESPDAVDTTGSQYPSAVTTGRKMNIVTLA